MSSPPLLLFFAVVRAPPTPRPFCPARLLDAGSTPDGYYYQDYTIDLPGVFSRHLQSVVALHTDELGYNSLFTLTGKTGRPGGLLFIFFLASLHLRIDSQHRSLFSFSVLQGLTRRRMTRSCTISSRRACCDSGHPWFAFLLSHPIVSCNSHLDDQLRWSHARAGCWFSTGALRI